ncbi:hypothetical protein F4804DRAFT_152541 [Jackrogersella minutella]|nr:hypothetical protein F4804DRAFT_152541 [Jackrogersella minutella]
MSSTRDNIRNSMLKHWRNSSISLSRSGSKRENETKTDSKASKRQSFHAFITTGTTTKSPVSQVEAPTTAPIPSPTPVVNDHEKQADESARTTSVATPSPKMTSIHVTVQISAENVERFLAAFKGIFDLVTAETDCVFFEVYTSPEEPGKISWIENWSKDIQWLMENQLTKSYYKEYFEVTEPMFLKPRDVRFLETVGPAFTMVKGPTL